MEQFIQKAELIYLRITSYAPYKEMNGIPKEWFVECIAKGLEEAATQPPSAELIHDEEEDDIYDAVRKLRDEKQPPSAPSVEEEIQELKDKIATSESEYNLLAQSYNQLMSHLKSIGAASTTQGAVSLIDGLELLQRHITDLANKEQDPFEQSVLHQQIGTLYNAILVIVGYPEFQVKAETGSQRQQAAPVWVAPSIKPPVCDPVCFAKVKCPLVEGDFRHVILCPDIIHNSWSAFGMMERFSVDIENIICWLDESQSTPSKESDAVEIMLWAFVNIDAWDKKSNQVTLSDGTVVATEQLYQLFLQSTC